MLAGLTYQLKQKRHLARCQHGRMREYLRAAAPSRKADFRKGCYLAVDLEMTGMEVDSDHILSIGFVPIDNMRVMLAGARHILVRSPLGVGQSAVIHGIHDRDMVGASSLSDAMDCLLEALLGRVLLLHYAALDLAFLREASQRLYGVPLLAMVVDTLVLENQRLQRNSTGQHGQGLRLLDCRRRYNLPDYHAHNALVDAVATAELFLAQVAHRFGPEHAPLARIVSG